MPKIVSIDTEQKRIQIEHLDGGGEYIKFSDVPDDFRDLFGPAEMVGHLSYWLGANSERARIIQILKPLFADLGVSLLCDYI